MMKYRQFQTCFVIPMIPFAWARVSAIHGSNLKEAAMELQATILLSERRKQELPNEEAVGRLAKQWMDRAIAVVVVLPGDALLVNDHSARMPTFLLDQDLVYRYG